MWRGREEEGERKGERERGGDEEREGARERGMTQVNVCCWHGHVYAKYYTTLAP